MRNPWHDYVDRNFKEKFHPKDRDHIKAFNSAISSQKTSYKYILRSDLEPSPYLGNPLAPVLVLLANPGAGGTGPEKNIKSSGRRLELYKRNLLHQQKNIEDYVAKFESPDDNRLESPYFKKHTAKLAQLTSIESVATRIFFVNFHGYQSKSWQSVPFIFPTQLYTFHLVRSAIRRKALIIMSRNRVGWFTSVPGLMEYKNRIQFLNTRNIYLTKGNFQRGDYKKILDRL